MIFLPILILHFLILSRLNFTAWPEMLAYPYLLSNGFTLYKDLVVPYTPGLIFLQTLFFNLFGFTPEVLRILSWILIGIADLLMFLILKKVTKRDFLTGVFLIIFIFLQSFFDGNMLWFDFASEIPLLLTLFLIFNWISLRRSKILFWIGLFLGLAFLIKQIALIYVLVFCLVYLVAERKIVWRELGVLVLGFVISIIPFLFYLLVTDTLSYFWLWSFYYPLTLWSHFPGYVDISLSNSRLRVSGLLLAGLGPLLIICKKALADQRIIFTTAFFATSILAVYPRFSYFHLQPPIAFLVILFALIYANLSIKYQRGYVLVLVAVTLLLVSLIYRLEVGTGIRFYSAQDQELANNILQRVGRNEKVWLLGLSSMGYVLTDRLPSKPWLDNFGWYLEMPDVQEQVIAGLVKDKVKLIVWQPPLPGEWYAIGTYQPKKVTEFIRTSYIKIETLNNGLQLWKIKD